MSDWFEIDWPVTGLAEFDLTVAAVDRLELERDSSMGSAPQLGRFELGADWLSAIG